MIQVVRNSLFPRDLEMVFILAYCRAIDSEEAAFNLFKYHGRLPYFPKKGNKSKNSSFWQIIQC